MKVLFSLYNLRSLNIYDVCNIEKLSNTFIEVSHKERTRYTLIRYVYSLGTYLCLTYHCAGGCGVWRAVGAIFKLSRE